MTAIDSSHALFSTSELTATLAALTAIDSVNPAYGGPAGGERKVLEYIASWLERRGGQPQWIETDPDRPVLLARLDGREAGPAIMFETHVDTVSAAGMTIDPFGDAIRDGRFYARGATDAKGQVAAMLHAFASWLASPEPPPCAIELALVSDEEYSFGGARALFKHGIAPQAIVIGEPTELRIVAAHKGAARHEIHFIGKTAHGAHPERGINALLAAGAFIEELRERLLPALAAKRDPLLGAATINVAIIRGGLQPNLVPESCVLSVERRLLPGETAADSQRELEGLFAGATLRFADFKAEVRPVLLEALPFKTDPGSALVRAAGRCAAGLGVDPQPIGVAYCTDASVLRAAGVPLIVAGPGSIAQAHTADEWIDLKELARGARFHAALMGWNGAGE